MTIRKFIVTARWDEEVRVFYSESDIFGLHVEASTIAEFQEIVIDLIPDLIAANHADPACSHVGVFLKL